jgi:hypothetical protein
MRNRTPFFEHEPAAPAPLPRAVPVAVDLSAFRADAASSAIEVDRIVASITRREVSDPTIAHADGTLAVDSMTAVCVLAMAAAAAGMPRLVNLRQVPREDLRSVGGVARLLRAALTAGTQGVA